MSRFGYLLVPLIAGSVAYAILRIGDAPGILPSAPLSASVPQDSRARDVVRINGEGRARPNGIRPDLFGLPSSVPPPRRAEPETKPAASPPPRDPTSGWVYTGLVSLDDQPQALVENPKTKESHFLQVGDAFAGGTVEAIDGRSISIIYASEEPRSIARKDDYTFAQLDQNAQIAESAPEETESRLSLLTTREGSYRLVFKELALGTTIREGLVISAFSRTMLLYDLSPEELNHQFEQPSPR